jgi:hypothetical protein
MLIVCWAGWWNFVKWPSVKGYLYLRSSSVVGLEPLNEGTYWFAKSGTFPLISGAQTKRMRPVQRFALRLVSAAPESELVPSIEAETRAEKRLSNSER